MTVSVRFVACASLVLAIAVPAVALSAFVAAPSHAQTATNLKCKGCVGKKDLGKKSVRKKAIDRNAVARKHIRANAVNSGKIANGTVAPSDLAATAKPSGGNYSGGDQDALLTSTAQTVRSVTVTAPADGLVVVNASGYVAASTTAVATIVRCSLTTGTGLDFNNLIFIKIDASVLEESDAFAATRGFPVSAGATTFNLVCDEFAGNAGLYDSQMTAIYVPQTY